MVELMAAVLAFSVLMIAMSSMLILGWRSWFGNNERVAMQRDATLAMMMISKDIRNSTYDSITDGVGISFDDSGLSYDESGSRLVRSDGRTAIEANLRPNSFVTQKQQGTDAEGKITKWVEISFWLDTSYASEQYSIRVSPRNGP